MVRPLTYFERILWRALKGLPVIFAFVGRVRGSFTREDLEEACRGLCKRHPTLGTQVAVLADGTPWFVPTLAVPITVTRRQADDAWVECVRRELMLPFDWEQAPALRLIWLQDDHTSDLVTIWNHGLLDGLAALVVFRDLLTRLGQPAGYETYPLPLSPGIEDLIPPALLRRRWLRLRMGAVVGLVKLLQTLPGEGLVVRSISLIDDLEVLPRLLTAEQTTLLVERCRFEGTTVLGSLCAAFLQAYADHAPAELA